MDTIVLRRPARTWWPTLLTFALVVMAGGVVVTAGTPEAGAAQTPESCANSIGLVNGGFEAPDVPVNGIQFFGQAAVPGWSTTASDGQIEIWHNNFSGVTAAVGSQHAELNANLPSALYQDLPTIPGTVMRWSLAHRGRAGMDTMAVNIGPAGGTLVEQTQLEDDTRAWGRYSGFYTVPLGQKTTRFSFAAVKTFGDNLSVGNFLDDITFGTNACLVSTQDVTSSSGGPYAQVGDLLTITVRANSGGGSPAMGTALTSPLPPGTSFVPGSVRVINGAVTASPTDRAGDDVAEYDATTNRVVVRLGTGATALAGGSLNNEDVGTVTYQVRVNSLTAPMTSSSESTVTFTDPLTGTVRTSTTNSASMVLVPIADVGVTLERTSTGPVVAGLPITYRATLTNNGGPSTVPGEDYAYATRLTSQLPAELTAVTGTTPGGSCTVSGSVLTCDVGTLKRGDSRTVTLNGTVSSDAPPVARGLALTVSGSTASRDLTPGNDSATATDDVTAKADVGVTLTVAPSNPIAGTDITYKALLTNRGPSTSRTLVLTDPVPDGLSNPRASVPGGTCTVPTGSGGTVRCELPSLAAGASTPVTLVFRTAPERTASVLNTLTVSATTPDPVTSDNTASLTTPLTSVADVRASLVVSSGNVPLGGSFTYVMTVVNDGPSTAVNTSFFPDLPPGFSVQPGFTVTAPTTFNCTINGCTVPSLAPGATVVLKGSVMVAKTAAPGRRDVTATVAAATKDPDSTNNVGRGVVYVGAPSVQVSVLGAITDTRRTRGAAAGDRVVWTYVVTNAGDVDLTKPTVVLPGGTTAIPTTCQPGTLPVGATAACHVVQPQTVTAADVQALAVTTTVQVTASWVGGTPVRSASAGGTLATVLPSTLVASTSTGTLTSPGLTTTAAVRPVSPFPTSPFTAAGPASFFATATPWVR